MGCAENVQLSTERLGMRGLLSAAVGPPVREARDGMAYSPPVVWVTGARAGARSRARPL
ncbi:hypothetical protein SGPA1_20717 [Streptomyces misionensis JCM 4497]